MIGCPSFFYCPVRFYIEKLRTRMGAALHTAIKKKSSWPSRCWPQMMWQVLAFFKLLHKYSSKFSPLRAKLCCCWHPSLKFDYGIAPRGFVEEHRLERFKVSAATLVYKNKRRLWGWMVLLVTGYSSGSSFIAFVYNCSLSTFQSLWYLLLPQVSVVSKGFPCVGVNVTCFHATFAYILKV